MLTSSTKYALKALICLAEDHAEDLIRVDQLAKKVKVPGPYLSKIMKILAKEKIIESRRGITGGIRLSPSRDNITFYEICVALKDPIISQQCMIAKSGCNPEKPCNMHHKWKKVRLTCHQFLKEAKIK